MTNLRGLLAASLLLVLAAGCTSHAGAAGSNTTTRPRVTPAAPVPPSPPPSSAPRVLRVVGLGDSVMAGTHCGCAGLAQEYGTALAARTGDRVHVTNLGTGGLVTRDLLGNLDNQATTRAAISGADIVLVTIGANDLLPELQAWRSGGCDRSCFRPPAVRMGHNVARVLAAVDALRRGHVGTVLVTNYWNVFTDGTVARRTGGQAQLNWSTEITALANRKICAAARSAGATCVDLVPALKAGGADPTPLLAADGDHPNAAGVRAIVRALLAATPTLS